MVRSQSLLVENLRLRLRLSEICLLYLPTFGYCMHKQRYVEIYKIIKLF